MDMRSRVPLFALLLLVGSFALPLAAHAGIPFFGPIIPQSGDQATCAASWGMLITVINNIISLLLTLAIVFVAPLMIAYSGFLFVVNPVNAGGKEQAKKILTNTIVGIVIALAGWMIVAAVMAVLYKSPDGTWGTWSNLITSGNIGTCLDQKGIKASDVPTTAPSLGVTVTPVPGRVTGGRFTFDSGIEAQIPTASAPLATLLNCMASKIPAGVGRISSISENAIILGTRTFRQCADQGCIHTVNSCHYGGSGSCNGESYAVDFGDEQNTATLSAAATACDGKILNEGDHLHVSVGAANGCSCDTRL